MDLATAATSRYMNKHLLDGNRSLHKITLGILFMASGINIYSQLLISAIGIADINNSN